MKKNNKYRILFMGTPEFAVPSLLKLIKSKDFEIAGLVTQPDKKSGRNNIVSYSPIKKLAIKNKINIYQPSSLNNDSFIKKINNLKLDIILVVAYGKIIPKNILNIPKFGSINIHPSLLPKYRGPSPMQGAILKGDIITGTTIMLMNEKMDEGDILYQYKIELKNDYNIEILHDILSKLSADNIEQVLLDWINKKIKPLKQDSGKATYTKIINKSDGLIDWGNDPDIIINKFRAYHPWPGVFNYMINDDNKLLIKIIDLEKSNILSNNKPGTLFENNGNLLVATANKKSIILKRVQIEGKNEITGNDFILGYKHLLSTILK